jgi:DNA-binding beta-propeller fold protein YncE
MACAKELTLNPGTADMPLDSATYLASADAIFGVRGPWVFKFNATTGALIDSAIFAPTAIGLSTIVAANGVLIAGVSLSSMPFPDDATASPTGDPFQERDLFIINPTTLAKTPLQFWQYFNGTALTVIRNECGHRNLVTDGTLVYGTWCHDYLYSFDPTNVAATVQFGRIVTTSSDTNWGDNSVDTDNSRPISARGEITTTLGEIRSFSWLAGWNQEWEVDNPEIPTNTYPVAVCYCPLNGAWYAPILSYAVQETLDLIKVTGDHVLSTINVNTIGSNARHIRYDPVTQRIYIPDGPANSVTVFNPATDTVDEVKTGFSMPWDVVFTPTKRFAVQNAAKGLLEIT